MLKRAKMRGCNNTVHLLTAKSDEESKLIGTEIGADVFLGKPLMTKSLARQCETCWA